MDKYFKNIDGDCIISISTGTGAEEITHEEYENILSIVRSRPTPEIGYDYKLRTDLTWETVEVEVIPEDQQEISDSEALDIILGGDV